MNEADEPKRDDDSDDACDRDAILARRRVFVTGALASLAMSACDHLPNPFACLSPVAPAMLDASVPEITPNPCLTPVWREPDAGVSAHLINSPVDTQDDSGVTPGPCLRVASQPSGSPDAGARPRACLRMVTPHPCLTPVRHCLSPVRPNVCLDFKSKDAPDDDDE
jgi:hypothetical protein